MTLYRDILRQSLKSAWQYKYLWFFGLFALLVGGGGELEVVTRGFSRDAVGGVFPGLDGLMSANLLSLDFLSGAAELFKADPGGLFVAAGTLLTILTVSLLLVWLSAVSQGALVHASARVRMAKDHDFRDALAKGSSKFWPVLGLNAIQKAMIFLVFLLLSLPIIASADRGGSLAWVSSLYILSFVVFVPVVLILSFIIKYAIAFVVIKNAKFLDSLKQAWSLFHRNWLISLEMSLILFLINFFVAFTLVLILLIISVPFLFMAFLFAKLTLLFNFWAFVVLALVIYIMFVVAASSYLSAFQVSAWTSLFVELVSRGGISKIVRIFSKD